jgi:multidrug efflux system outer membrane protein
VARAAYFPTISLSKLLGISNVDIQNLYSGTMRAWLMGATLAGPVIDFGRTDSGVDMAFAKKQELLASYKNAVRSAFKDVKDALSEQANSQNEEQAQAKEEKAVKEALRLATLRYMSGYSSYIEVLDAERNLYGAQIGLIATKLKRLNASVNLYKALGGGWMAHAGS